MSRSEVDRVLGQLLDVRYLDQCGTQRGVVFIYLPNVKNLVISGNVVLRRIKVLISPVTNHGVLTYQVRRRFNFKSV